MSQAVLDALTARFGEAVLDTGQQAGDEFAVIAPDALRDVALFLRDDPDMSFEMPIDCTAVDYRDWDQGAGRVPRFDVVYHLNSVTKGHRIRLIAPVGEDDPTVPSVRDIYPGLDWFERETFDMYGIIFAGHGDLRRILMYEEYEGHPLRKDHPHRTAQPRTPMRDLPDADIHDAPLGPQPRPPGLRGDPVWRGEEGTAPAEVRPNVPGLPGPQGEIGGA